MFKKPNNSILTLQQVEFLVNLELNWWGIHHNGKLLEKIHVHFAQFI